MRFWPRDTNTNNHHARIVTMMLVLWLLIFTATGAGITLVLKRILCGC